MIKTTSRDDLKEGTNVKTPCGHKDAVCFNVYPFDLWECTECHSHFKIGQIQVLE